MTVLELRFPAGRYHATPWGRHVNEGAVEWPPSPWRLLRSLIATWYLKARSEVSEETLRSLIHKLASSPPEYDLPTATNGHTRHYMPIVEGKNQKTTKVFDTFIQIKPDAAVRLGWAVELTSGEEAGLGILADRLGYFGRAESLVEATLVREGSPFKVNSRLLDGRVPDGAELVRLLSPLAPEDYNAWKAEFAASEAESTGAGKGGKPPKKKSKGTQLPNDLFEALHADTADLQAAGWNLPPGGAMVSYVRSSRAFAPAPRKQGRRSAALPTVARYAVVSSVAPRITQAVSVADRVHKALCKWSDQSSGVASVFTGKDDEGNPFLDHRHAHIFCEANGDRDEITHITVTAAMGFDEQARLALRRMNKVWGHAEGYDIRLVLIGIGAPDGFADCRLFAPATKWRSLTPLVSTRHAKTFRDGRPKIDPQSGWQIGGAAHELLRFLAMDEKTEGATIKKDKTVVLPNGRNLRCLQFLTRRPDGAGSRGNGDAGSFIIEFTEPVQGPLAFGYGSHFGLGLFVPAP